VDFIDLKKFIETKPLVIVSNVLRFAASYSMCKKINMFLLSTCLTCMKKV